jgi:hypothetical protein
MAERAPAQVFAGRQQRIRIAANFLLAAQGAESGEDRPLDDVSGHTADSL